MDVVCCMRSLIKLQGHLQRAMAMQEEIQRDLLATVLRPEEQSRFTSTPPKDYGEDGGDIEACLAAFEEAASVHKIPQGEWTQGIIDLVGVKNLDLDLDPSGQHTYEAVKERLRSQARMAEDHWEVSFTLATFDSAKGPRALGQGLDEAARCWLKPARRSAEDVVRRVALRRFITLLPSAARDWVTSRQPEDMEQAIGLAEQFLGTTSEEKHREMEVTQEQNTEHTMEATQAQNTKHKSVSNHASEIRTRLPKSISLKEKERHVPCMKTKEEETSVTLNLKVEGLGLKGVALAGNEPEPLATAVKQEPMEDHCCADGVVSESAFNQGLAGESSAPDQPTARSSTTASRRSAGKRPSIIVKNILPVCADITTASMTGPSRSDYSGHLGNTREEKHGETHKEVTSEQYTGETLKTCDASEIRISQPISLKQKEDQYMPCMKAPDKPTSSKSCQSVSFDIKGEQQGEMCLEEKGEAGNKSQRLATVLQKAMEPMEDDYCGDTPVFVYPSIHDIVLPPSGMPSSAATASRRSSPKSTETNGTENDLSAHMNESAPIEGHVCSDCGDSFAELSLLDGHRSTCNPPLFTCHDCEATFTSKIRLSSHRRIHSKLHSCPHCAKRFRDKHGLCIHLRTHGHCCRHCERLFPDAYALRAHVANVHARSGGERPHWCPDCGASFADQRGLLEHGSVHTVQRPTMVCPEPGCGKTFTSRSGLRKHCKVRHSDLRPHLCTVCRKTFKFKHSLTVHQLVHTSGLCAGRRSSVNTA
ncbi:zinc finger and SCAN domain-containing protein 12-like isoform X2 [Engraulis encrasicolus]|uniref:zinc finger and SCAN domain-containing protein 12-like isoform X2 n=1 Tax=Engraulis encrasicolus TaxID=184585 RepID=UPI002FD165D6